MKKLLLLALLPLLLSSCKRLDGDTLVEGQVVDKFTGAPVPHAWVEVYESRGASWGGYAFVEKHQANGHGDFGFQFEGSGDDYLLRAYTDLGHSTSWNDAVSIRQGKNNKKLMVKADAPAWLKVRLIDEPPFETDVHVGLKGFDISGVLWLHNPRDISLIDFYQANQTYRFAWWINKGVVEEHYQDIFYQPLDTVYLEIKF